MSAIDSLLKMLVQQSGDEILLQRDATPKPFREAQPLRLYFPALNGPLYAQMTTDLLTDDRRAELKAGRRAPFQLTTAECGVFDACFTGADGHTLWLGRGKASARMPGGPPPWAPAEVPAEAPPAEAPPAVEPPRRMEEDHVEPGRLVPELIRALLARARASGWSDVHWTEGASPVARVDGRLHTLRDVGAPPGDVRAWLGAHPGDSAIGLPDGTRVRVHIYRASEGLAVALRVLPGRPPSLAALGLPEQVMELAGIDHGLVLIGGPIGSGKTTTLAALTQARLQLRRGHVVTLEDPIEYHLEAPEGALVHQRQVRRDVRDMVTGLHEALRQDAGTIVLGELRDPEAIQLALTAAETGQLVLATLHCRSAASAIERIVDVVPPGRERQVRGQLAEALRAVVVQRLLPRADADGRVLAVEVLRGTRSVASLIREGKTAQIPTALQTGLEHGMIPLERQLMDLIRRGRIDRATAEAAANLPDALG
jgi:twitching motility protein PilT